MKILILSWRDIRNPFAGGAEVFTHENAKRWVSLGNEVTWFSSSVADRPREEVIDGVRIIRRGSEKTVHFHVFRKYRTLIKNKFDIVIDQINTIPFLTPLYVKETKIALIFQLARRVWFYESFFPLSLVGYLAEYIYLKVYRNTPVFTISESTRQDLINLGFKAPISIVPIGIYYQPLDQIPEKETDPTLIYVGRLRKSKRIHHIIKALDIVKRKIPNIRLWIIGAGGKTSYIKKLHKLMEKYNLKNNIKFCGFMNEPAKLDLIKHSHAIIVTSAKEGWGLVVTEANALGTPAITYNVSGLKDSVRDKHTGILTKENNSQALSVAILNLLENENLYHRLAINALEWSKKFSWQNSAQESLKVLEELHSQAKAKEKKNIVLIAEMTIPPVSRANLRTYRLGLALVNKGGHRVYMITPSKTPLQRSSYYQQGIFMNQFWGFSKYLYSRMRLPIRFYHLLCTIASIIYLQLRFFDIYRIHAWNPLASFAAVIAAKIVRKPVYIDFTDFYSDIAKTDFPAVASTLRLIERFVLSQASKIFVVSDEMINFLIKNLRIDREKLFVVPEGVDSKMFAPSANGSLLKKRLGLDGLPIIIYHGDIKHADGVDLLLQSLALVVKKIPEVKLLIVGGASGQYSKKIRKIISQLKLGNSVHFTGWVEHFQVPEYIALSDVGSMPMRATLNHNCYLSFKLFEYWAMAKPVVVSRLKAISKIVKDGINGYIFEPENVEDMAKAYIRLFTDKQKAQKMGQAGRELIEKEFDWDKVMSREAILF